MYVVYYSSEKGPWRVRIVNKGFACTQSELPREIKTHCKALSIYKVEEYSELSAARAIIDHCLEGKWIEDPR